MIAAWGFALLALGVCVPQGDLEKKIDEIIPRLSDDSIDVRDRAVGSLVELGSPAVAILRRRANEVGAEIRGRLLEACSRIESQDTRSKYLPPVKGVTLDWENRPAREALEEIARRTGLLMDSANVDGAASFSVKDATPLEAIDAVCKSASLSWRTVDEEQFLARRNSAHDRERPRIVVQNGKSAEYPVAYCRNYRIRATEVSLTRTNTFEASQSQANLGLDLGWAPGVKPDGLQSFTVTEIKDDQGRSLLIEENDRLRGRIRGLRPRYRGHDSGSYRQTVSFKYPDADVRKIASVKGIAVFSFPQEEKTVTFDKPSESEGKSVELSGLTITLKEFRPKGAGLSFTLEMTGKFRGAPGDSGDEDGWGGFPFASEDVELVTETGEPPRARGISGRGDGKSYSWTFDFNGDKPILAKEIKISCVLRHFHDEVKFELKEIALPR